MQEQQPSRTALGAAARRAVHQLDEAGRIFHDPLARRILGREADRLIAEYSGARGFPAMELFIAARSRFAEDCLTEAVGRGVRQAVVLGAGLDTLALRQPHADAGLEVFEVDHPATQLWKRHRIAEAGLVPPPTLIFVPVDFERDDLAAQLAAADFDAARPAFFIWLGVVPYLRRDAILRTLTFIAGIPAAEVVFDYSEPLENFDAVARGQVAATAARAAAIGEPWLSFFDPAELSRLLAGLGFAGQTDLGMADIAIRYRGANPEGVQRRAGGHVIHARREA
jgi:methyltransferase (TIGR00027 family)